MELSFDVFGEHRLAGILDNGIAQHFDRTGFPVDFDIDQMGAEARSATSYIDFRVARDSAAVKTRLHGNLGQRQGLKLTHIGTCRTGMAVLPDDLIQLDLPDSGSDLAHTGDGIAAGLDRRHTTRRRAAAASCGEIEA